MDKLRTYFTTKVQKIREQEREEELNAETPRTKTARIFY